MATKETETVAKPTKKRPRKPVSLKIESKRKKARARAAEKPKKKAKLVIKKIDMKRIVRKSQVVMRRSLKEVLKGVDITHIPDRVYKKIDSSIAKNPVFSSAVEAAVISIVNTLTSTSPASKNGGTRAKKETKAATEKKAVTEKKPTPRKKKTTKTAPAESVTA
jgi:hypothetical protein